MAWREEAVPGPATGRAMSRPARNRPQPSRPPSHAPHPGDESDLAASQRPGPTVIYEGFKCLGLLGKQFGAGSFDCRIQSLGTFL